MEKEHGYTIIEGVETGLCKLCGAPLGDTIGCTACDRERKKIENEQTRREHDKPKPAGMEKFKKDLEKLVQQKKRSDQAADTNVAEPNLGALREFRDAMKKEESEFMQRKTKVEQENDNE